MAKTMGKIIRAMTSILLALDLNFWESQKLGLNFHFFLPSKLFKLECTARYVSGYIHTL